MKFSFTKLVALTAVNVVVELLAGLAFLAVVMRDDPVLAVVPGFWAWLGVLPQPWFLLFLLADGLLPKIVGPVATAFITLHVYGWLDRYHYLDRFARPWRRIGKLRLAVIGLVLLLVGLLVAYARHVDFPALRRGMPDAFRHSGKAAALTFSDGRYYCLAHFLDTEYLWQAQVEPRAFREMMRRLRLSRIDVEEDVPGAFMDHSPYWWKPTRSGVAYATEGFPAEQRGSDGWHALVTYEAETHMLHAWIKDNF